MENIKNRIRQKVSGKRNRLVDKDKKINLDMSYIS